MTLTTAFPSLRELTLSPLPLAGEGPGVRDDMIGLREVLFRVVWTRCTGFEEI